jgi:hypothetical protein
MATPRHDMEPEACRMAPYIACPCHERQVCKDMSGAPDVKVMGIWAVGKFPLHASAGDGSTSQVMPRTVNRWWLAFLPPSKATCLDRPSTGWSAR